MANSQEFSEADRLIDELNELCEEFGCWAGDNRIDWLRARLSASAASLRDALTEVEQRWPGSFWHMAKGRVRADEPLFGFQVLFGADEVLAEGEGDDEIAAIRAALAA